MSLSCKNYSESSDGIHVVRQLIILATHFFSFFLRFLFRRIGNNEICKIMRKVGAFFQKIDSALRQQMYYLAWFSILNKTISIIVTDFTNALLIYFYFLVEILTFISIGNNAIVTIADCYIQYQSPLNYSNLKTRTLLAR